MKPQVVVVGSFVQDLTFRCAEFPRAGETVLGRFATGPGGKGSNQAVACARAGVATRFVGAVGRDVFGDGAKSFHRSERVAARWIEKPRAATGTATVMLNAEGQNQIIVALGANEAMTKQDLGRADFAGARVVVAQFETALSTTEHVLKSGRAAKAVTVLNPAPMRADFHPALLRHVDVLIPNETEFAALVNVIARRKNETFTEALPHELTDRELHALVRLLRVPTVIVTLGKAGCFVSSGDRFERLDGHTGIQVVDTTGAGDAFVGGFAAGLVETGDVFAAARFANAVAALSVTQPGTAPSMPRRAEIKRFLSTTDKHRSTLNDQGAASRKKSRGARKRLRSIRVDLRASVVFGKIKRPLEHP